ncbi:MAG: hypothetical protein DI585_04815 [Pseudomonas fluorescens]|nr:MAG: hypothetical protein DI585_04815 [Pseudomonas fluorescens]
MIFTQTQKHALIFIAFCALIVVCINSVTPRQTSLLPAPAPLLDAELNPFVATALSSSNRIYATEYEDGANAARGTGETTRFLNEVKSQHNPGQYIYYLERDAGLSSLKDPNLRHGRQSYWMAYAKTMDSLLSSTDYDVDAGRCYDDKCFLIVTISNGLPAK